MPSCFTELIHHVDDCLHLAPLPLCRRPPRLQGLSIGTLNIHNGKGFGHTQDVWEVQISGFDLMILIENKVTNQAYYNNSLGYDMVCFLEITTKYVIEQGGVGMVVWDQPKGWSINLAHLHGLNVVRCVVVACSKRTPLIGKYLNPSTLEHLPDL